MTGAFRQLSPAMYDERVTTHLTRLILLFAMLFTASMPAIAAFDVEKVALGDFCESAPGALDAQEHTYFVGESGAWVHNDCTFRELRHAARILRDGGYRAASDRRIIIEGVRGGASFAKLNSAQVSLIRTAAQRLGKPISLVGSRVDPLKALGPLSEYDFVVKGLNAKWRRRLIDMLPRGQGGGTIGASGRGAGIDILENNLIPGAAAITFH